MVNPELTSSQIWVSVRNSGRKLPLPPERGAFFIDLKNNNLNITEVWAILKQKQLRAHIDTQIDQNITDVDTRNKLIDLQIEKTKLENEIDEDGKDLTNALYEIDFVKESNISAVCKWLDKNIEWDIKNAALTTTLYDTLKS